MWYYSFVVRALVRHTALPATSHPLGPEKNLRKSNHCHTSAIFACNSFVCRTYKNKGLKVLYLPHLRQKRSNPPVIVNQVPA